MRGFLQSVAGVPWNAQMILAMLLVGLAVLAFVSNSQDSANDNWTELFTERQLMPAELERIEASFGNAMLTEYTRDRGSIRVPANKRGQYLAAIRESNAFPQSFHAPTDEAISSASIIETSRHQSQRWDHAKEKEARLLIRSLPNVIDAFVQFDTTASRLRGSDKATAAVGVKTAVDHPLDEKSFRVIQAMLLNFKIGLTPDSITIADLTSRNYVLGDFDAQAPEVLAKIRKADLERSWEQRLGKAIEFVPGARVIVQVLPNETGLMAKAVSCSVNAPFAVRPEEANEDRAKRQLALTQQIQSAILPLLPNTPEHVDRVVAVNLFARPVEQVASRFHWTSRSRQLLPAILFGSAALVVLLFLRLPKATEPNHDDYPPNLKIYQGDTEIGVSANASEQLQAFANENPDAVAESLIDFIDRAS